MWTAQAADRLGTVVFAVDEIAFQMRVSDIHIDPIADAVRIRFRIDGVLVDQTNFPKKIQAEVISRIKILASLRTIHPDYRPIVPANATVAAARQTIAASRQMIVPTPVRVPARLSIQLAGSG